MSEHEQWAMDMHTSLSAAAAAALNEWKNWPWANGVALPAKWYANEIRSTDRSYDLSFGIIAINIVHGWRWIFLGVDMNRAWREETCVCVSAANICERPDYNVRRKAMRRSKVDYSQLQQICTNSVSALAALYGFIAISIQRKNIDGPHRSGPRARSCFCCPLPYLISSLFH